MDRKTRFGLKLYGEEDLDIYVETRTSVCNMYNSMVGGKDKNQLEIYKNSALIKKKEGGSAD